MFQPIVEEARLDGEATRFKVATFCNFLSTLCNVFSIFVKTNLHWLDHPIKKYLT